MTRGEMVFAWVVCVASIAIATTSVGIAIHGPHTAANLFVAGTTAVLYGTIGLVGAFLILWGGRPKR